MRDTQIGKLPSSLPRQTRYGTSLLFIYTFYAGFSLLSVSSNSVSVHRWMDTIRTLLFSNSSSHLHTGEKKSSRQISRWLNRICFVTALDRQIPIVKNTFTSNSEETCSNLFRHFSTEKNIYVYLNQKNYVFEVRFFRWSYHISIISIKRCSLWKHTQANTKKGKVPRVLSYFVCSQYRYDHSLSIWYIEVLVRHRAIEELSVR